MDGRKEIESNDANVITETNEISSFSEGQSTLRKRKHVVTPENTTNSSSETALEAAIVLLENKKAVDAAIKWPDKKQNLSILLFSMIYVGAVFVYCFLKFTTQENNQRRNISKNNYDNDHTIRTRYYDYHGYQNYKWSTCLEYEGRSIDQCDKQLQVTQCTELQTQYCKVPLVSELMESAAKLLKTDEMISLAVAPWVLLGMRALFKLIGSLRNNDAMLDKACTPEQKVEIQRVGKLLNITIDDNASMGKILSTFKDRLDDLTDKKKSSLAKRMLNFITSNNNQTSLPTTIKNNWEPTRIKNP